VRRFGAIGSRTSLHKAGERLEICLSTIISAMNRILAGREPVAPLRKLAHFQLLLRTRQSGTPTQRRAFRNW